MGAYWGAAEAFLRARNRARLMSIGDGFEARLKTELDRVEQVGLKDGLHPEAMRRIREAVEQELTRRDSLASQPDAGDCESV